MEISRTTAPSIVKILLVLPDEKSAFLLLREALRDLGHEVDTFYYRSLAYPELTLREKIVQRLDPVDFFAQMNRKLIGQVKTGRYDLVFINKGEIIYAKTVDVLSQIPEVRVASWYVDSPLWFHSSTRHIAQSLKFFDIVFVFDGHYTPEIKRWGAKRVEVLPFGCDPAVHKKVELTPEEQTLYGSPVCFIGNYQGAGSDREKILDQLVDCDVKIWGAGWQHCPIEALKQKWAGRPARQEELVKIYSASRITVNVTHPQSITQPNLRTFEAAACGILLINDWLSGLKDFFDVGREIEVYTSVKELKEKLGYYLSHPKLAEEIGQAGQRRAYKDHAYRRRMAQMLESVLACPK